MYLKLTIISTFNVFIKVTYFYEKVNKFTKAKYIFLRRETWFYIFAKNKCLHRKQPNSHICFCMQSATITHCTLMRK